MLRTIATTALLVMASGCATIVNGANEKIGISSTPAGARVLVDDADVGNTPLFVDLKRRHDHTIKVQLLGHEEASYTVYSSASAWMWGNLPLLGIGFPVGLVIDVISGGAWKLSPEQVQAMLKSYDMPPSAQRDGVYIFAVLAPDPSWEKIGNVVTAPLKAE